MGNAKWTLIAVGYQTGFAYIISLILYQLGMTLTGHGFGIGTIIALILTAAFIYLLVRPYKETDKLYRTKEVGV